MDEPLDPLLIAPFQATLWSTLKPECLQDRMLATTSSVILPSARSSANTSCSQSLRKGSVASLGQRQECAVGQEHSFGHQRVDELTERLDGADHPWHGVGPAAGGATGQLVEAAILAGTTCPLLLDGAPGHQDVQLDAEARERWLTWLDTYAQRLGHFCDDQEHDLLQLRDHFTADNPR